MLKILARVGLVAALCIAAPGCTLLSRQVADIGANSSATTPSQVTSLGDADLAADAVVNVTHGVVDTNKLDAPQLGQLQADRAAVRKALDDLHTAAANNQNLNFAAFNAALDAWNTRATQLGIAH